MDLAPIVIFCYKRVDCLKRTLHALKKNRLAAASDLIVYSDGPKGEKDLLEVEKVRKFLEDIEGFNSINIRVQTRNLGLAKSVISGVGSVIDEYGKVIVVEEDLITSPNFLSYMNQALSFYRNDPAICSISGYTPKIDIPMDYPWDTFFALRSTSWGWATWKDRWEDVDWKLGDFDEFSRNKKKVADFKVMGSNLFSLLKKQYNGKIDSWAIRWCYDQFKKGRYSVYPVSSKVQNIGFGNAATHTTKYQAYFETFLDEGSNEIFLFQNSTEGLDQEIIKAFQEHYGLKARIFAKIKSLFSR